MTPLRLPIEFQPDVVPAAFRARLALNVLPISPEPSCVEPAPAGEAMPVERVGLPPPAPGPASTKPMRPGQADVGTSCIDCALPATESDGRCFLCNVATSGEMS